MKYKSIFVAAALAVSPAVASADTIDFTDLSTYQAPNTASSSLITGTTSFNVGYRVTSTPSASLSFSQLYSGTGGETNGLAEERDGLGVGDDEITNTGPTPDDPGSGKQVVTVAFERAVRVTGLHFLDLFLSPNIDSLESDNIDDARLATERMQVWIDKTDTDFSGSGDRRVFAVAQSDDGVGYRFDDLIADISPTGANIGAGLGAFSSVRSLSFTTSQGNDAAGNADGALAAIDVAPVPLPASILFLLGGLGGLAALRRRKTA